MPDDRTHLQVRNIIAAQIGPTTADDAMEALAAAGITWPPVLPPKPVDNSLILRARVEGIPHGDDGWYHSSNGDTYEQLAVRLVALGLSEDDAVDVLSSAFHAAADEFGA